MSNLDWQNDSDYAYTENLGDREWAWEFLRRSKAYRAAWVEYTKIPVDDRTWRDSFSASASTASSTHGYRRPGEAWYPHRRSRSRFAPG